MKQWLGALADAYARLLDKPTDESRRNFMRQASAAALSARLDVPAFARIIEAGMSEDALVEKAVKAFIDFHVHISDLTIVSTRHLGGIDYGMGVLKAEDALSRALDPHYRELHPDTQLNEKFPLLSDSDEAVAFCQQLLARYDAEGNDRVAYEIIRIAHPELQERILHGIMKHPDAKSGIVDPDTLYRLADLHPRHTSLEEIHEFTAGRMEELRAHCNRKLLQRFGAVLPNTTTEEIEQLHHDLRNDYERLGDFDVEPDVVRKGDSIHAQGGTLRSYVLTLPRHETEGMNQEEISEQYRMMTDALMQLHPSTLLLIGMGDDVNIDRAIARGKALIAPTRLGVYIWLPPDCEQTSLRHFSEYLEAQAQSTKQAVRESFAR